MNNKNLNEILKQREALEQKAKAEQNNSQNKPLALDDTQRVKVLSPGRLVAKSDFLKTSWQYSALQYLS